jgi:hypothetical protein
MTAQKISDILYNNGYEVSKYSTGYETPSYTVHDKGTNEKIFSCIGTKDLKEWFEVMSSRFDYQYNPLNVPKFDLNGMCR